MGRILESAGYCHCCRKRAVFSASHEWLRDHYVCTSCASIPRMRNIQYVLDTQFPGWEAKRIHESSPSNDFISRWAPDYSTSQFFPGVAPGAAGPNGVRCENIESLTYADASFDLFITQDVLEHVFHPDRAVREILRVLRPGGAHVFTAPKHKGLGPSYSRAHLKDTGEVEHRLPPEYHGNPIGDGRALVTWDYGQDFEALLSRWAAAPVVTYVTRDRSLGLDGEYLEVFVIHRPAG